jgi:hypothetical protein
MEDNKIESSIENNEDIERKSSIEKYKIHLHRFEYNLKNLETILFHILNLIQLIQYILCFFY